MKRAKYGFTTVELIVIVAVIGILAAIIIPSFISVIGRANSKSAMSDARNLATQYVIDAFHSDEDLPENLLIAVYKDGDFYLYGYDMASSGSLLISDQNPYEDYEDFADIVEDWSFNKKHPGVVPDVETDTYDPDTDGTFYLVPYNEDGTTDSPIKSVRAFEENGEEVYHRLSGSDGVVSDSLGTDEEVIAYHGILLPGTYQIDGDPITDEDGEVVDPRPEFTVSFSAGELEGDSKVVLPETQTVKQGTIFTPSYYSARYSDGTYVFTGWDIMASFRVEGNATLTAQWELAETYTVTFDKGTGETLNLASMNGYDGNGGELPAGTDITELVRDSVAEKAGADFIGWLCDDVMYPNDNRIFLTKDMEFVAQFADNTCTVTIDPNNGEDATETQVSVGQSITLPDASAYTAPQGKVFGYWTSNLPGDQNHYAAGAEGISVTQDVTFTANWVENEFTVVYDTAVPAKAMNAGLEATLPEDKTYTVGTSEITIGGAELDWYNVTGYVVSWNNQTVSEGQSINTSTVPGGTEIVVTPQYLSMKATFRYRNGGYSLDQELPANETVELVDIREGYTVLEDEITCTQNYLFLGWADSEDADTLLNPYEPGSTYEVTKALDGKTITFLACFDEEQLVNMRTVTFKYWDYQNYNDETGNVFGQIVFEIPIDTVIDETLFMDENENPMNMLEDTFTVTAANGTTYTGRYEFAHEAIYSGDWTDITITESTEDGLVVFVPTYMCIDIGAETDFAVVTTAQGLKNVDRGEIQIGDSIYNISLGGNFVLANDITLSGTTAPLGYCGSVNPTNVWDFEGVFDGLGYTIKGFTFNTYESYSNAYVGLFSSNVGTIRNIKMEISSPVSAINYVGIVAGSNDGTIENVVVNITYGGCVLQGYSAVGGIAGINSGTIRNAHVYATAASTYHIVSTGNSAATCTGPTGAYSVDLTGTFLGGITGCNDGGTITLSSVGGGGSRLGITCTAADSSWTSIGIGGIVGVNVNGTVDQCWAYNADLNRYFEASGGSIQNVGGLQAVGGISGLTYGGILQHCWVRGSRITVGQCGGGITGMLTQGGKLNDCWCYFGGADTMSGYESYVGDVVSSNAVGGSCTITNCAVWDAIYTGTIPSGVTNYSTLSSVEPANCGLSSTYFMVHSNGPMLINNGYTTSWAF